MAEKLKPISPSLRERKRYIAVEIISEKKVQLTKVIDAINNVMLSFLGQLGAAKAGLVVLKKRYNEKKQRLLVKVSHKQVHNVKAALTFIRKIDNQDAIVRSLGVSGIIKKAVQRYLI